MKQKRLLLLLALLVTAATGAWAQVTHRITATITSPDKSHTGTIDVKLPYTVSIGDAYKAITGNDFPNDIRVVSLYGDGLDVSDFDSSDPWNTTITVTAEDDKTLTIEYNKVGINDNLTATVNISMAPFYSVKLAVGTADAGNWTATVGTNSNAQPLPVEGLNKGDAVTLSYTGRLKVKSVTATTDAWMGDLSNIPASALDGNTLIVPDGATLKGKLSEEYSVVIPDGATVTLAGVTILGTNGGGEAYNHAGITCEGDATIILADNSTNTVKGFHENYPGIYVPEGKKLTIKGGTAGNGKLTASSNGRAAGIGAGISPLSCGNIEIQGGDITAIGGGYSAGIGSGFQASCGTITISGGTVEATGSAYGAGIGSGKDARCGNITITDGVTLVTATKGSDAPYSIGAGDNGNCGTITIGGTLDTDGNPIGGTVYWQDNAAVDDDAAAYLAQAKIVYPDPLATPLTVEALTAGTIQVKIGIRVEGTLSTGMKYSTDGGTTKTLITQTTDITVAQGDKVQFYGNGTSTQVYGGNPEVSIQGSGDGFKTKVYGNIMSLLDEEGFATKTDLPNAEYVFYGLFLENTTLIDASELLLPAATLASRCYHSMFVGCTSLTTAPKLPATELAVLCYFNMFYNCTSLTNAYVKAAYTDVDHEFDQMFDGCTATGAVLHTTSDNKANWENMMGSGTYWDNWSVADDWQD